MNPTAPSPDTGPERWDLDLDSYVRTPYSPEVEDWSFRGIIIRAPRRLALSEEGRPPAVIPLCGLYFLEVAKAASYGHLPGAMRVVATDQEGTEYAAHLVDRRGIIAPARVPSDLENIPEGFAAGMYFNVNLAGYLSLSDSCRQLEIFVHLGERQLGNYIRSNVVQTQLLPPED